MPPKGKSNTKSGRNSDEAPSKNNKRVVSDRLSSEELGFQIRSGPDRPKNATQNLDIEINDIILYAGRAELLAGATLKLVFGMKYGLIGRNGVGKSTLLNALVSRQIPIPPHVFVLHVEQEIPGDDTSVIDAVIKSDKEREWILQVEEQLLAVDPEVDSDPKVHGVGLMEVYERLDELNSDDAEARAAMILTGLGFDHEMQMRATREFSGGWRMRVALAQALYMQPDLLLLDEPTNHLDLHALTWLEEFLSQWEKTVMIVSHDRGFLNNVTTATVHLHRKRLCYYGGNYDTFIRVRAEHRANQEAIATMQSRKTDHLKSFIARFGQGHKKMAAQAQSRMKMLKKLQEEAVSVDYDDPYLCFSFDSSQPLPPPCISVIDCAFGYSPDRTLYANLNFGVDCESRVAIIGPNGAGKSTFLQLLDGTLVPTDGAVRRHAKLVIARFTQHHVDTLDLEADSIAHIRRLGAGPDDVTVNDAYRILSQFGLGQELATRPVGVLSGGQKSRLAFAQIAFRRPHIILFDEPSNHLDLETIEGLAMAINKFEGGVVLISHDERLINMVADELWTVMPGHLDGKKTWIPGTVAVFNGSFGQYKKKLKQEFVKQKILKNAPTVREQDDE